ncbi:MAG: hypothetical protein MJ065_02075 [Oscillospiraceae bacterium]|nr:hypothetical protein [Oscillospiraceae bacterium]
MNKAQHSRLRIVLTILFSLLAVCTTLLAALRIWHISCSRKESALLQAEGYQFAAADGSHALSYCRAGAENAKHILITIADTGENDLSVQLALMSEYLGNNAMIVCIDRAGCGLSGDSTQPQTAEQIVSDYRTALQNANIQPPYVLLPHAEGGLYAVYWQSLFPEEIEGVFFLSGTSLKRPAEDQEPAGTFSRLTAWLGFERLMGIPQQLPPDYPPALQETARILNLRSAAAAAQISERKLLEENRSTVSENIVTNDIPKAFIDTAAFQNTADWLEADNWERSFMQMPDFSDEERAACAVKAIENGKQSANVLRPYLDRLGNCQYYALTGSRYIHMQKPMQCAVLLSQFLAALDEE